MRIKAYIFYISFIIILNGCKENLSVNNSYSGNLVGLVRLRDSTGNLMKNHSGVKVSLEGLPRSVISDSTGKWELKNISYGNYNIVYEKSDYALEKNIDHQFVGKGIDYVGEQNLYPLLKTGWSFHTAAPSISYRYQYRDSIYKDSTGIIQTIKLKTDSTIDLNNSYIYFSFRSLPVLGLPQRQTVLVIFGNNENITLLDPATYSFLHYEITSGNTMDSTGIDYYLSFFGSQFLTEGFKEGEKIYCRGYFGGSFAINSNYPDNKTGKQIYTAFDSSEVRSFYLP